MRFLKSKFDACKKTCNIVRCLDGLDAEDYIDDEDLTDSDLTEIRFTLDHNDVIIDFSIIDHYGDAIDAGIIKKVSICMGRKVI